MSRKKRAESTVRVTVSIPQSAYERFERMASVTGSDVPSLVRILSSLQLISWEGMYLKAAGLPDSANYEQAQNWVRASVPGMFPDVPDAVEVLAPGKVEEPVS